MLDTTAGFYALPYPYHEPAMLRYVVLCLHRRCVVEQCWDGVETG